MSYTQHSAIATCKIANVLDTNDLISQLYDYLTNHEDEIPYELEECGTFEEFAYRVEDYLSLTDGTLQIMLDTEDSNCDNEIFDFLTNHYALLMVSKFQKVVWVSYDSRAGLSGDCSYYDNTGKMIDVEAMLNSR